MKCRYRYEEYPRKQIKQHRENKYNIEELYVTNEEQEYQVC